MRALRLAAVIMLLASPAVAQSLPPINLLQDKPGKTQEEKDAETAQQKAYKESLKKIPDAKQPSDPWGSVRADGPAPAKSSSPTTKKARTTAKSSSAN